MSENLDYRLFYRRHLPHYQPAEGLFFVTYRLAFSMPQKVLQQQKQMLLSFERRCRGFAKRDQQQLLLEYQKKIFALEDVFLGTYHRSPQWLRQADIANLVLDILATGIN
jgi:hypothetical protein